MGKLNGDNSWSKSQIGRAIRMENLILLRLAYTFGNTSQNNNNKNVTVTTSVTNLKIAESILEKESQI